MIHIFTRIGAFLSLEYVLYQRSIRIISRQHATSFNNASLRESIVTILIELLKRIMLSFNIKNSIGNVLRLLLLWGLLSCMEMGRILWLDVSWRRVLLRCWLDEFYLCFYINEFLDLSCGSFNFCFITCSFILFFSIYNVCQKYALPVVFLYVGNNF